SRLTLNGDAGKQLNITLSTSDVNDLLAATTMKGKSPVDLQDRTATFNGAISGRLSSPQLTGQVTARGFSVEGRRFRSLSLVLSLAANGASIREGNLARGAMQTQFSGQIGLKNWQALPNQPLSASASIRNGDVADLIVLSGRQSGDFSGALNAGLQIHG